MGKSQLQNLCGTGPEGKQTQGVVISGASQVVLVIENPPANAGDIRDLGLIPGSGRSQEGHGNTFQYSCLENPMAEEPSRLQSTGSQRVRHE